MANNSRTIKRQSSGGTGHDSGISPNQSVEEHRLGCGSQGRRSSRDPEAPKLRHGDRRSVQPHRRFLPAWEEREVVPRAVGRTDDAREKGRHLRYPSRRLCNRLKKRDLGWPILGCIADARGHSRGSGEGARWRPAVANDLVDGASRRCHFEHDIHRASVLMDENVT